MEGCGIITRLNSGLTKAHDFSLNWARPRNLVTPFFDQQRVLLMSPVVYSIIESPAHPNFSAVYHDLGLTEHKFVSMRKAIGSLKKHQPGWVVAEFFYGYGNNYAGINLSNLDVFLRSLQKYAPEARVLVLVDKEEYQYVDRLVDLFPLYAVLVHPVTEEDMARYLSESA